MGVNADSVTARMWTSLFHLGGIAAAVFILLQRDRRSQGWGRGVTPNPTLISGVHGVAWPRYRRRWIRRYGPGLVPHKEGSELGQRHLVMQ